MKSHIAPDVPYALYIWPYITGIKSTGGAFDPPTQQTINIHVGDLTISDTTLDEDSANNEFTLTCISTGGPATTVTWTRNSETAEDDSV